MTLGDMPLCTMNDSERDMSNDLGLQMYFEEADRFTNIKSMNSDNQLCWGNVFTYVLTYIYNEIIYLNV